MYIHTYMHTQGGLINKVGYVSRYSDPYIRGEWLYIRVLDM